MPRKAVRQRRVFRAVDVGFPELHCRRICLQRNLVGEGIERMRIEYVVGLFRRCGIGVVNESLAPDRERQYQRAVAALGGNLIEQPT